MHEIRCDLSFSPLQRALTDPNDRKHHSIEIDSFEYGFVVEPINPHVSLRGRSPERETLWIDLEMHVHSPANAPSFLNAMYDQSIFGMGLYLHSEGVLNESKVFALTASEGQVTSVAHHANEGDAPIGFLAKLRLFHGDIKTYALDETKNDGSLKSDIFKFGRSILR